MSSYYTSPFEVERRRLQGIVDQCERDLDAAIREVCSQQEHMQQAALQQKKADAGYESEAKASEQSFKQQQAAEKKQQESRKKQLQRLLDDAKLEISILEKKTGKLEEARERQRQLTYRLQTAEDSFDVLEQEIRSHIAKLESEAEKSIKSSKKKGYDSSTAAGVKKGKKAVSLQTELPQQEQQTASRQKPQDLFSAKLEAVMASPCAERIPSAAKLAGEFAAQPEYAKAAFAVKHMKQLEDLEARVRKMEESAAAASEKREKAVLQYRALCKLLEITPDEELISSDKSGRKLAELCVQMKRSYQEKKKHAYIASAVKEVMGRRGIVFQDAADAEGGSVMQFSMDNVSLSVSGLEHERLVMEVSGKFEGDAPTLNERRQAVSSARRFCSLLKGIEEELRDEFGIIFVDVTAEEPAEETILMQKNENASGEKHYTETKKEKSLRKGE